MNDPTRIFEAIERGCAEAADELLPLVYDELRRLAARKLAGEQSGQTLQPTALVHEAYLRIVGDLDESKWDSHGHFFAAAAESMRRILVERARRRKRTKHGGELIRVDLEEGISIAAEREEDLAALDEALNLLAKEDPSLAKLVNLRFFAGLKMPEIARVMGISLATAERRWTYARTWLYAELAEDR